MIRAKRSAGRCLHGQGTATGGCPCAAFKRGRGAGAEPVCSCGHEWSRHEQDALAPVLARVAAACDALRDALLEALVHGAGKSPHDDMWKWDRRHAERLAENAGRPWRSFAPASDIHARAAGIGLPKPTNGVAPVPPKPVPPKPTNGVAPAASSFDPIALGLAAGERKILAALFQYAGGRTRVQLAILTGYTHSGGTFSNYLGHLASLQLIDRQGKGKSMRCTLTPSGDELARIEGFEPLPTGRVLLEYWYGKLDAGPRRVLSELIRAYPEPVRREALADRCKYEATGGAFSNALGRLRTLELIEGERHGLRVSSKLLSELYPELS
jgi:hypothetical protein